MRKVSRTGCNLKKTLSGDDLGEAVPELRFRRRFAERLIFLAILVLLQFCPVFSPLAGSEAAESYTIGVGDMLRIEVYEEPEMNQKVRVLTDGNLSFPLIGTVKAEGLTVGELRRTIAGRLAEKYLVNPQVMIYVEEFSNVFVFGEVRSPGVFPLAGKMTVFEAVTLAGGFTEVANKKRIRVIRKEGEAERLFEVNLEKVMKEGDVSEDLDLRANDRVIVPRSFF